MRPFPRGSTVDLRYVLTDGRIEMCWPCRVVEDTDDLVALFIVAGSRFKADPKRTAAEKRARPGPSALTGDVVWRTDMLRVMLPGRSHSVWLFWTDGDDGRRLTKYFVNMEEPFRRTAIGFDTQDHTLDIVIQPDLSWSWRDEDELENHVSEGFFTADLATSIVGLRRQRLEPAESSVALCVAARRWTPRRCCSRNTPAAILASAHRQDAPRPRQGNDSCLVARPPLGAGVDDTSILLSTRLSRTRGD
jgi:hypothetical protein